MYRTYCGYDTVTLDTERKHKLSFRPSVWQPAEQFRDFLSHVRFFARDASIPCDEGCVDR